MFSYQFHIRDYLTKTRHLTQSEDLAYRRLLDCYYTEEQPLPSSPEQCARLIAMRENTTEVEAVLKEFFQLQDDGWHNERADAEIAKYKSFGEAGKRGAAKRWGNREANGEATSPPNPTPIATNNHKPKTNKPIPVGFEEFWKAYPRKIAKPQAEKAWAKICPDEELNKRIHKALSVAKQSKDWTKDGGQYIPYPATWLNQNRWEDEHGTSEGGVNWDEVLKEAV